MCCRYLLLHEHLKQLLEKLGLKPSAEFLSRYNITPGVSLPSVRKAPRHPQLEVTTLHWGLIPTWAKSNATPLVNARAESLSEKPSFRDAFARRRCVLPASGFFEWEAIGRTRKPWLFRRRDEAPFFLAGLWEPSIAGSQTEEPTFAVVTTEPNELMRPVHHRQPLVLNEKAAATWLDSDMDMARLNLLLNPFAAEDFAADAVSRRVSNVRNDDPECLLPSTEADGDEMPQLSLEF